MCLHVHTNTCTQMRIKTQSSILKMVFIVVILLPQEPTGSLGLIRENACEDPHLSNPLNLFHVCLLSVMCGRRCPSCCFLSPCSGSPSLLLSDLWRWATCKENFPLEKSNYSNCNWGCSPAGLSHKSSLLSARLVTLHCKLELLLLSLNRTWIKAV